MATPLSASAIVAALRAEGLTVVEVRDWRNHNRNSKGDWGPVNGVILHHTVSTGTDHSVDLCYDGYAELPGPLCHGVIDKQGVVHLVGNGRANHAGGGDPDVLDAVINESYGVRPPVPNEHQGSTGAVDGNAHFYGFECINLGDGKDPWPDVQVEAMVRASAALCRAHGWGGKSVIGHKEWSDWKSDPTLPMPSLRDRVAQRLAHLPSWSPTGSEPSQEEDVALTAAEIQQIAQAVWAYGISNRFRPDAEGKPKVIPARYYQEWSDSHYDDLLAAVKEVSVGGVDLDALADKVADKLAARLAE